MAIRAVLFDIGGVVLNGPMEEFARYERRAGLPDGLIRRLNSQYPDANAWARYERGEVDEDGFVALFEAQADAAGHRVDARQVLAALHGQVCPAMVTALHRLRDAGYRIAALTNNVAPIDTGAEPLALFELVLQSSVEGVRKPEPAFYELALRRLGLAAADCAYLDDLGINLKPARAMGMATIKVTDPDVALRELGELVGLDLTG